MLLLLVHDSDDDAPIQSNLNNLVVTEPCSSNLEAIFLTIKQQKTTFSPSSDMPPKLRDMMDIVPPVHVNHTSSDLILNDYL